MQTFQIDGTFTFIDNIKTLKIGDMIKLIKNPNNKINSEAVGAYTMNNKKIGYVSFKANQINLKSKYSVTKINLTLDYPQILISREFELSNIIPIKPRINEKSSCDEKSYDEKSQDLKDFTRFLKRAGHDINNIMITWQDENYINLLINTSIFYTVTKKYYEEHIFYYDELFKFNLIPKCIYQPFQVHRLEEYIMKSYKPISKILKSKKLSNLNLDLEFKTIKIEPLIILDTLIESDDTILYAIQYIISNNPYYNLSNINNINIDSLKANFNELKVGGIAYNHIYKLYCNIDCYDDNNIILISTSQNNNMIELIIKAIIADKKIINIVNPLKGIIKQYELSEDIINSIKNILEK